MKKPKIICVSGKARHGKDELCKIAIELMAKKFPNLNTKRLALGDAVKNTCANYFDCTYERNDYNRTQWQFIGTDLGRTNHPDIWVNIIVDLVKGIFIDHDYIFLSDCRFPNEIQKWKDEGFDVTTVRVVRPNFKSNLSEEQLLHPSETSLDNYEFDYIINNDRGLEGFHNNIKAFLSLLKPYGK